MALVAKNPPAGAGDGRDPVSIPRSHVSCTRLAKAIVQPRGSSRDNGLGISCAAFHGRRAHTTPVLLERSGSQSQGAGLRPSPGLSHAAHRVLPGPQRRAQKQHRLRGRGSGGRPRTPATAARQRPEPAPPLPPHSRPTTNLASFHCPRNGAVTALNATRAWRSPGMQSGSVGVSVLPQGHRRVHRHYQRRRSPRCGVHGPQALLRAQAAARRPGSPMQCREWRG